MNIEVTQGKFAATWESLQQYECPQWFQDAKFGVWAHWGPQSIPQFGDWYARNMYIPGTPSYRYHRRHFGHPSEFGYKDIIPLWKAEKFEPDVLMEKYKKMGAKFFVTMGVHHDNFDCWDSKYNSFNAVNMGPHRDIVSEWKKSAEKYGMRFGVSEHLERSYSWFASNKGADKKGKYKNVPYDGNDKKYSELYLNNTIADSNPAYPDNPSEAFVENFYLRIKDLVETYDPDWLYTDGGVPFGEVGLSMIANFYNSNMINRNGKLDAVYCYKDINHLYTKLHHGEYEPGAGILDLERTLSGEIRENPWQTDTCLGNWFYDKRRKYKSARLVLQEMCDVVSKNGTFLLSVPIKPDGTIDEKEEKIIDDITAWMEVNGEAIYETRPFEQYGEGPFFNKSAKSEITSLKCTYQDFRFTKKGNVLYAISMNSKGNGKMLLKSLGKLKGKIDGVEILGSKKECKWEFTDKGLQMNFVQPSFSVPLCTAKITLKKD